MEKSMRGAINGVEAEARGIYFDGRLVTLSDLPDVNDRWSPTRKAIVVAAIEGGLITRDAAFARYNLSEEEFQSWKAAAVRRWGAEYAQFVRVSLGRDGSGEVTATSPELHDLILTGPSRATIEAAGPSAIVSLMEGRGVPVHVLDGPREDPHEISWIVVQRPAANRHQVVL